MDNEILYYFFPVYTGSKHLIADRVKSMKLLGPYEGSGDSQQSPYEPRRMDDDEHLKVFLQSVGQEERDGWCKEYQ